MNRNKFSLLLAIVTTLSTSLPASAQLSPGDVNVIGIGASILSGILNPPHRATEILADAEVKKAKIAAEMEIAREKLRIAASQAEDKVTPVLKHWGVSRVICAPGLVFVNGVDGVANTVCIQPTPSISAGYYTYDSSKRQLLRTSNTVEQNIQNVQNIQNNQTNQSTTVTSTINSIKKGF